MTKDIINMSSSQMDKDIVEAINFVDRYKYYYGWREDEIQDAYERFVKHYNPTKGSSPSTFIKICIDSIIQLKMKNSERPKHKHTKVYLDKAFNDDNDEGYTNYLNNLNHVNMDKEMDIQEDKEIQLNLLKQNISKLTKKQELVITEIYINGKSGKEIADELNESPQLISYLHRAAINKLQKLLK